MPPTSPRALIILVAGVEEIEAITPIDLLRRAGFEVTIASLDGSKTIIGRNNIGTQTDVALASVLEQTFDVVILPGGPGVKHLRASSAILALARTQAKSDRLLAAICAAPTVLRDAGVLPDRFTAHFSVEPELPGLLKNEAVVRDGNIITSRGAGTAIAFSLAIIAALLGDDTSQKVAGSICYPV